MTRVLSDGRLAERAIKGDERAFAAIFRRYHQSLYRFCLAIVGNSADAQDALQNTMVKVLRALPGEQRRIELEPWLYRIAHNESVELLRRRRESRQLDAGLAAPGSGLADEAASRERLRRLISDLDELPERQRGALVMRELAGLGFEEIGAALGTSAAVARQALYEARLGLRKMDEGREMSCETVSRALSDGDGRVSRRRDVRAHLRACASCRRFGEDIEARERDLAALSPLPALAAAGLLQGLLGGGGGGAGGGLVAALGGGAANSVSAAAALKGMAVAAAAVAIGAGAADRGGLIDVGWPGEGGSQAAQAQSAGAGPAPKKRDEAAGMSGLGERVGSGAGMAASLGTGAQAGIEAGAGNGRDQVVVKAAGDSQPGASPATQATNAAAADPGAATASPGGGATGPSPAAPNPDEGKASPAETAAPTAPGGSSTHPNGKGHTKELPSASEHGQQTAAANKGAEHAAQPTKPSSEAGPPPSPPGASVREEHSQAPATPPASPATEGPPGQGKGKKSQSPP